MNPLALLFAFLLCLMPLAASAASAVRIGYALWDGSQLPAVRKIIAEFERRHPQTKVDVVLAPSTQYWVKMEAAATGNAAPDVMWMNMVNIRTYALYGVLEPLDAYVAQSGLKLSNYVASAVQAYAWRGRQYGIPRDIDSIAVWYNKRLFDAAGVPYPGNDWTWDDMVASARRIKAHFGKTNEKVYPIYMDLFEGGGQTSYYSIVTSNGGAILNDAKTATGIGDAASTEALKRIQALMAEELLPNARTLSGIRGEDVFQSNRIAMFYAGSWMAKPMTDNPNVNRHIGVVELPRLKVKSVDAHSLAHVMSRSSRHKNEAWKLIEFMSGDWAQSVLAETRAVIPAKLSAQTKWIAAFPTVDVSAHVNALRYSYAYPFSLYTNEWEKLMNDGLRNVWLGADPAKALAPTTQAINRVLASESVAEAKLAGLAADSSGGSK